MSPDGSHAAVGRGRWEQASADEDSLAIIDLRTGAKTRIGAGEVTVGESAWSPGGRWLGWPSGITSLDGTGTIDVPIVDFSTLPVWSPDDSHVSVATPDGLSVGDGSGANLHRVGAFPQVSSWSFDGTRFAFLRAGDA